MKPRYRLRQTRCAHSLSNLRRKHERMPLAHAAQECRDVYSSKPQFTFLNANLMAQRSALHIVTTGIDRRCQGNGG